MRMKLLLGGIGVLFVTLICTSHLSPRPSFNGTTPGCGSGGGCHTRTVGIFTVATPSGLTVQVTVTGVTQGDVAGELVDSTGTVVDVVDLTSSNPFMLTAPGPGTYVVDAGYKNPSRQWDSVRVTFTPTAVRESRLGSPQEYLLGQNYPNPFNPTTVIAYALPTRGPVTLKIYNVLGQEVATLADEIQDAGYKSVRFDAFGLSSGVYFYRLQAGKFAESKKLLLLR